MKMSPPEVTIDLKTREELITVQEFAERARMNHRSIYRLIKKKELRGVVRVGSQIRINARVALAPE